MKLRLPFRHKFKLKFHVTVYPLCNCRNDTESTVSFIYYRANITLFRMGLFRAAHGWVGKKAPLPKICHTYPTMIKLGTVIPYLMKVQQIYESSDTFLKFC